MNTADSVSNPPDPPAQVAPYQAPAPAVVPYQAPAPAKASEDAGVLEVGAGAFLFSGAAGGAYGGISPFVVDELGQGVLLRPSFALGQSLATGIRSTFGAARFDTCWRVEGPYPSGLGIQLDLCGGIEAGFAYVASGVIPGSPPTGQTLPFVALGPSLDLRAEINPFLAVTLRASLGFDVAREHFQDATGVEIDAPPVPLRLELGFSWDLRGTPPEVAAPESAREGIDSVPPGFAQSH